jgi:molybdate transport system substrate-binding protein
MKRYLAILAAILVSCACSKSPSADAQLVVAAAANLTGAFNQIASEFRKQTGAEVVLSFGSTSQLAKQIENGAPFDVFAAADTEHIDRLVEARKILAESRAVYARGRLSLWVPQGEKLGVRTLQDLVRPEIRFISIAQPELAPYGKAHRYLAKRSTMVMDSTGLGPWEANISLRYFKPPPKVSPLTGPSEKSYLAMKLAVSLGDSVGVVPLSLLTTSPL